MPRQAATPAPRSLKVSAGFRDFVFDQLEELGDVAAKPMFGGIGLYRGGIFFGILARDTLYLKTGPGNRADYTRARAKAFKPFLDKPQRSTTYFAVPLDVLESAPALAEWARKAIAAAASSRRR
jgi:DNA transformation protein and related proteins